MNQVSISSWLRHWRSLCSSGVASNVECNTCRACCKGWDVALDPSDSSNGLETVESNGRRVLKRKENGDCVYLTDQGCSIYAKRPRVCRQFDCRAYCVAGRIPDSPVGEAAKQQWQSLTYRTDQDYVTMIAVRMAAEAAEDEGIDGEGRVTGRALGGAERYMPEATAVWQSIKELKRTDPDEYQALMDQFQRGN